MPTFRLEVVTPGGRAFSDDVDSVVIPGSEGEFGVLAQHMPLMTEIKPGELEIRKGDRSYHFAVGEGFVEVIGDRVSVLTDMAFNAEQIDEAKAEEARRRAEAALEQKLTDEEVATVTAALERSLAQLRVKRRRSGSR
jgi:F-type H+-transporting ATPase subunit epsilon